MLDNDIIFYHTVFYALLGALLFISSRSSIHQSASVFAFSCWFWWLEFVKESMSNFFYDVNHQKSTYQQYFCQWYSENQRKLILKSIIYTFVLKVHTCSKNETKFKKSYFVKVHSLNLWEKTRLINKLMEYT